MNTPSSRKFTFGRNWRRFLRSYTPQRQKIARECLLNFLKMSDLKGKSFLDIGSGSGLHSAAALLAGAERVHSFDYDPDSVAATKQLREHHGSPAHWTVTQGSVLDADFIRSLGKFDIVYAWGMLHHTGNQWEALTNAALPLDKHSRLYIALYAKEAYADWQRWVDVKRNYNTASRSRKFIMEIQYIWETILGRKILNVFRLPKIIWQYKHSRGMDFMTDVRDWLGGWPTEFSSVPEVVDFANNKLGLELVNLHTGEGNSEFLLVYKDQVNNLGYGPIDLSQHYSSIPVLEDVRQLSTQSVWIFGTGRGGDLMFNFLTQSKISIAGFIDIESRQDKFHHLPVLSVEAFIQQPKTVPVVLANRYFKENGKRLRSEGYLDLYNAHPLVIRLHRHQPIRTAAA